MPRTVGPVMPSPRAGTAIERESSSVTRLRASSDRPPPPYSCGTSIIQMPSALALAIMRLDLLAIERVAFDRNELGVHEPPQRILEQAQLLGKLEVHSRSPYF